MPRPGPSWEKWQTDPKVIAEIDRLLDDYIECEIVEQLNAKGFCSGKQLRFHTVIVARLCKDHGLKSRYQRLRDIGMLTQYELAKELKICPATVRHCRTQGRLIGHKYSACGEYLYERPDADHVPVKTNTSVHATSVRALLVLNPMKEVQYETHSLASGS